MDHSRRQFLATGALATLGFAAPGPLALADSHGQPDMADLFGLDYPTGVAVSIVKDGQLAFVGAHGWADRENRVPMSHDTLINVASVTKTITSVAVMQLVEQNKLELDVPIDEYLPFVVRNPRFPDVPLTIRQLLTHRSSLTDGPVYDEAYECGGPPAELGDWLAELLVPGGSHYDAEANFHSWSPGTSHPPEDRSPYSNVGYGLLGHIAECVTGNSFTDWTRKHILNPLRMSHTDWMLADIDTTKHAIPYERMPDETSKPRSDMVDDLWRRGSSKEPGAWRPVCLYGHTNYPDGFLRTSAADIARFLTALCRGGELNSRRILQAATLNTMLTNKHFGRAICWNSSTLDGKSATVWYHGGYDPGVTTMIAFRPSDRTGVAVLANSGDPGPRLRELVVSTFAATA